MAISIRKGLTWAAWFAACGLAGTASIQAAPISNTAAFVSTSTTTYSLAGVNGSLPSGMALWHSARIDAGITYGSDSDGAYAQFLLINPTAPSTLEINRANPGAYMATFGNAVTLSSSTLYRLTGKIKVLPKEDGQQIPSDVDVNLRYYVNGDKSLPNLVEGVADNHRTALQTLQTDILQGSIRPSTGEAITTAQPIFYVDNLLPGEGVRVRLYSATLSQHAISSNLIYPLDGTQTVRPGGLAKVSVKLGTTGAAAGLSGTYIADFQLVVTNGTTPITLASVPVSIVRPTSASALREVVVPYQGMLPTDLTNGTYGLQVRLRPQGKTAGVRLTGASTSVSEFISTTAGYAYRVGTLKVDSVKGGLFLGATAVQYPYSYDGQTLYRGDEVFKVSSGTQWGPLPLGLNAIRTTGGALHWRTTTPGGTTPVFDPPNYTRVERWANGALNIYSTPQITLADWAAYFSPANAPRKNLLINTWGVPYEASSDPTNTDNLFYQGGVAAPVSAAGMGAYNHYLSQLFANYGSRMFGIECGNEPNSRGFWTGTQAQLADSCKAIWEARKASGYTSIPILCPQVDSPERMGYMLSARTTEGRPLTDYCDWVGAHIYSGMGSDTSGKPYSTFSLAEQVRTMRVRMQQWGVNKPLVVTEFGFGRADYNNQSYAGRVALDALSDVEKADAVFQSIATLQENGVTAVILYALDTGENFLWTLDPANPNRYNDTVMRRIKDAMQQMGATRSPW